MQKLKEKVKEGKEMKRKLKFSMTLIILVSSILLLIGGKSQATLQSNPNTHYTKGINFQGLLSGIREMEATNGAMGLSETKAVDLKGTKSNNIDVHFMKSTEYGAIAILSMSGYGNPSNAQAITTTTGNNTGMMLDTNYREWTAATNVVGITLGSDARYYDLYGDVKIGDALGVCKGWHSATTAAMPNSNKSALWRGFGGIFSYRGTVSSQTMPGDGNYTRAYWGRGVAVCGEGL